MGADAELPASIAGRAGAATAACPPLAAPSSGAGRGTYHTGGYVHGLPGRYRLGWRTSLGPKTSNANVPTTRIGMPANTSAVCAMLTSTR